MSTLKIYETELISELKNRIGELNLIIGDLVILSCKFHYKDK